MRHYKHRDQAGVVHVASHLTAVDHGKEYDRQIACQSNSYFISDLVPPAEKDAVITCMACLVVTDRALRLLLR